VSRLERQTQEANKFCVSIEGGPLLPAGIRRLHNRGRSKHLDQITASMGFHLEVVDALAFTLARSQGR
jgi:hypothetical protein